MSDTDLAGLNAQDEGAILAEIRPMPAFSRLEAGTGGERPRPGGNGGRPDAGGPPLRRVIEAVLFASDKPVSLAELAEAAPGCQQCDLTQELEELAGSYEDEGRGFELQITGAGYQIRTHPEMHEHVTRFLVGKRRARLSRAAMETLAIVAYRQPITRGEAEQIRGVDCGHVLHTLLDRGLVTVKGRSQALGRPLLYGTTDEFLHYFGIRTLADLPSPEELRDLIGEDPLEDLEVRELMEVRGLSDPIDAEMDGEEESSRSRTPADLSGDGYHYVST